MKPQWLIVAVAAVGLLAVDATYAAAKHRGHHARHAQGAPVFVERAPSFAPPRMIEVRPGVIISSYDCITDEGYGRWRYCGQGRR